eukprot:CAMPEP_0114237742 /NCGR_PEP_ID=MMETSP0058-20121206/7553_1 /TAXON_ID=36894 /ORGANISM="Pyramimonas parkeae, CCMP726" /LENGTH=304 /DNA_ID=CAMNT_0001349805 /DNA_START=62 /DNA_END=973 /DNA_ORIENTATION=-
MADRCLSRIRNVRGVAPSHQLLGQRGPGLHPLRMMVHLRTNRKSRPFAQCRAMAESTPGVLPAAILFDCDGVLVDTEKDGHRVSFNETFRRKGLACHWDVEKYGELVKIGGGKERMTKYFSDSPNQQPWASLKTEAQQQEFVKELHLLKTDLFMKMIETGSLPLRPGVARLVDEAAASGVPMAVCSTSNERAVSTIVRVLLGADVANIMRVFAGDIVPKKKPDPAIYLLAAEELGVDASKCVVFEDSHIGVLAAKAAGMKCVVTKSGYTEDEDFDLADAVFPCIGEAADPHVSFSDLMMTSSLW